MMGSCGRRSLLREWLRVRIHHVGRSVGWGKSRRPRRRTVAMMAMYLVYEVRTNTYMPGRRPGVHHHHHRRHSRYDAGRVISSVGGIWRLISRGPSQGCSRQAVKGVFMRQLSISCRSLHDESISAELTDHRPQTHRSASTQTLDTRARLTNPHPSINFDIDIDISNMKLQLALLSLVAAAVTAEDVQTAHLKFRAASSSETYDLAVKADGSSVDTGAFSRSSHSLPLSSLPSLALPHRTLLPSPI